MWRPLGQPALSTRSQECQPPRSQAHGLTDSAGYVPVRWTVDTLGWEGTAGHISASVMASRVLAAGRPGEIVLMHVGSNPDDHTTFDADALPR
jgi:peptidoglycan/xylan/chitin deacetylase (PgdA/CDA1 family)